MGISFQPQDPCSHSFLRQHIQAMIFQGELAKDILAVEPEKPIEPKPDEQLGGALMRFLYPQRGGSGPHYIDIPFIGPRPGLKSLSQVLASRNDATSVFVVTGPTGSGKTTACVRTYTDINLRKPPFDRYQSTHTSPRLACWISDYDFLYAERPESAFYELLGTSRRVLRNSPPIAFFIDLDRLMPQDREPPEGARRRLAQLVLRLSKEPPSESRTLARHTWILMVRTQTVKLPDERIPRELHDSSETWSPLPLNGEHGEAARQHYLEASIGDPVLVKEILQQLGELSSMLESPLTLYLFANYVRTRLQTSPAPDVGAFVRSCSPGKLWEAFVSNYVQRESNAHDLSDRACLLPILTERVALVMLDRGTSVIDRNTIERAIAGQLSLEHFWLQRLLSSSFDDSRCSLTDHEFVRNNLSSTVTMFLRHSFLKPAWRRYSLFHDSLRDYFAACAIVQMEQTLSQTKTRAWNLQRHVGDLLRVERTRGRFLETLQYVIDLLPTEKALNLADTIERRLTGSPSMRIAQNPVLNHAGARLLIRILRSHPIADSFTGRFDLQGRHRQRSPAAGRLDIIEVLGKAIVRYIDFGKQGLPEFKLIAELPCESLDALLDLVPEFTKLLASRLRHAEDDADTLRNVMGCVLRMADRCDETSRSDSAFELRCACIARGLFEQGLARWVCRILDDIEDIRPVRLAELVSALLESGVLEVASTIETLRASLRQQGAEIALKLATCGETDLGLRWRCNLVAYEITTPDVLNFDQICLSIELDSACEAAIRAAMTELVWKRLEQDGNLGTLAKHLIRAARPSHQCLKCLIRIHQSTADEIIQSAISDYLLAEFLGGNREASKILVQNENVEILRRAMSPRQHASEVAGSVLPQNVAVEGDVWQCVMEIAENDDVPEAAQLNCIEMLMGLPLARYPEERRQALISPLVDGLRVMELETLKQAVRILETYRTHTSDDSFWFSCQKKVLALIRSDLSAVPRLGLLFPILEGSKFLTGAELIRHVGAIAGASIRLNRAAGLDLSGLVENNIRAETFLSNYSISEGMMSLLTQVFERLEGKSGQCHFHLDEVAPGVNRNTLIALGLLAKYPKLRAKIMSPFSASEVGKVRVVAFTGRKNDAALGIWGEITTQLGKCDSFKEKYYSPPAPHTVHAWVELLKGEPTLILLDVSSAFHENVNFTLGLQNFLEAVRSVEHGNVCVVTSAPSRALASDVFSKLTSRTAMVLSTEHVPSALKLFKNVELSDAEVPDVLFWLARLLLCGHPAAARDDISVRDAAAKAIDSIIKERWGDVPDEQRIALLRILAERSDNKSEKARNMMFRILSEQGARDTAEYLERMSVCGHSYVAECRKVAAEIRSRLDAAVQQLLFP